VRRFVVSPLDVRAAFGFAIVVSKRLLKMARGMTHCRICGKPVPSIYRQRHESSLCLKMRFDRGDPDVVARFLLKGLPKPVRCEEPVEPGQLRLGEIRQKEGGNYQ
jgi:hypothetical protein